MATGLSSDRLARIDSFFKEKYIDTGRLPGALTLVARRGEIAHFSTLGHMDVERNKLTQKDTIYRIYSMTKALTSVALLMLYEEGHFQLNDPIHSVVPYWKGATVLVSGDYPNFVTKPADREITFRDLLSHQSGLTSGNNEANGVERAYKKRLKRDVFDGGLAEWSKALSDIPLLFSPGTAWNYSSSTDLCGHLVEVISGNTFDQFLNERIIHPLGMVDTGFSVPELKIDRFAANYVPTDDGGIELSDDPETSAYRKHPQFLSGGGGLVSTAIDYYKFLNMLYCGGISDGQRYLSRKTIESMATNHLTGGQSLAQRAVMGQWSETSFDGVGFGLGFSVLLQPSAAQIVGSPGQYAWGGAASTAFWIDPAEEMVVIFMTQLQPSTTYPIRRELQVLINSAIDD